MKIISIIILVLLPSVLLAQDTVKHWKVVAEKSSIAWTVNYGGKPVGGSFPSFSADIAFDPVYLDKSSVNVKIDVAKVKSGDSDAQENLPGLDWFATGKYPAATFTSNSFKHMDGDNYEADGMLTIRDKTIKMILPFSVKFSAGAAVMDSNTFIKRLDFGVGQGEWKKPDVIADEVKLSIHIEAN